MAHVGTCIISRASLGLGNLDLQSNGFYVANDGVDIGEVIHRRIEATSPYLAGAVPTSQVQDNAKMHVTVSVEASDHTTLQILATTLMQAFSQWSFGFVIELDSTLYGWACYKADFKAEFKRSTLKGVKMPIVFSFPRYPVPVAGPI